MAIDLDLATALRGTHDLRRLVDAILSASDHDEADWVEWKSGLDLTTKHGCFHLARNILGMANRTPDRAALSCEGLGYIVIGAEPGNLAGIDSVDPAALDQIIEPYLGGPVGPRWTPTYVGINGKTVLVVTVEAPAPGNAIFTLRREYDGSINGTVFVRKHGRTVPADAADMDALQLRLKAASAADGTALEVEVVGDVPLSWFDPSGMDEAIAGLADERRRSLIHAARAVERRRNPPASAEGTPAQGVSGLPALQLGLAAMAQHQESVRKSMYALGGLLPQEDQRTIDQYIEQVDAWRDEWAEAAKNGLPERYVRDGHGVVRVEIRNLGSRFLPDVELEVRFEFEPARGLDKRPERAKLPAPPREYGKPEPHRDLLATAVRFPKYAVPPLPMERLTRRTWVEDGSVIVTFRIGDLRQHASDTSDDVFVVLVERPEGGVLHGTWKATVRDVDGVFTGVVDVPVTEEPVAVATLFAPKDKTA